MDMSIGIGPDSWGVWFADDPRQPSWQQYLDEAAAAGYSWIELGPFGYLPTQSKVLEPELRKRGLKVASSVVIGDLSNPDAWPAIERQVHGVGQLLSDLDAKFIVLVEDNYTDLFTGEPISPPRLDDAAFQRLVDTTSRAAEIAQQRYGLRLLFHAGTETHVEHEDQIEQLLSRTDPELVSFVLDTGYHAYGGGDVVGFMKKHANRIPYVHLKDFDGALRAKVAADNIPLAKAVAMGVFVELSTGVVDFAALRDTLDSIGFVGFGVVEQDMFPAPLDKPFPIAKRTRKYLRDIGMG